MESVRHRAPTRSFPLSPHTPENRRVRVTIVDDTDDTSEVLTLVLSSTGEYDVRAYTDPVEALGDIVEFKDVPDILLLDNRMPQLTGVEFLTALKDAGRSIPTVLSTAGKIETPCLELVRLGVEALLPKPFELEDLTKTLKRVSDGLRGDLEESDERIFSVDLLRPGAHELEHRRAKVVNN